MKVGVTGGSGFIGSWVTRELKARGHEAVVLDHSGRAGCMLGDVRDSTIVYELAAHVDGLIHLAAVLGTVETIDQPLPAADINIVGTLNVFEAASRYDLPVVYAAVGNSGIGRGTYCITKTCGEQFTDMYRDDRGLKVIAVRPMNAYGPGQSAPSPYGSSKVRKIVPSFVCSALSGDSIQMYGGGTQISDAVFVGDVARAFVSALETAATGKVPEFPIDVGNRVPIRVRDLAEQIATAIPGTRLESVPMRAGEPHGGPIAEQADVDRLVDALMLTEPGLSRIKVTRVLKQLGTVVSADVETLEAIGVEPDSFMSLDEGLNVTIDWFRHNEGITWSNPHDD